MAAEPVVLAVLVAVGIGSALYAHGRNRQWHAAIATTAEQLGLDVREAASVIDHRAARGTVDGLQVVIERFKRQKKSGTRILVSGDQPRSLRVGTAPLLGSSTVSGDPAFDAAVLPWGEPEHAIRARLDAATRDALRVAVSRGASLSQGLWTLELGGVVTDPPTLAEATHVVIGAARALRLDPPTVAGLALIAATDPIAGVRENALISLIAQDPSPSLLEPCLSDPVPLIAVRAARALGEDGRSLLVRFVATRPRARVQAALGLADLPIGEGSAEAEEVLLALLEGGDGDAIAGLGRIGTVRAVPLLSRWVGIGPVGRSARDAIRTIQSRVVGGERGALSVADGGPHGALAIADVRPGALSVEESED